jgi:antirestriction protein ArdC
LPPPAQPAPLEAPHHAPEGDELGWALPPLKALAARIGSSVEISPLRDGLGGYYQPQTKRIVISDAGSINAQIATLVHELAHALVRAEPGDADTALTYAEEELVVESVAFTVCGAAGLDTTGSSIPYLASWAQSAELSTLDRTARLIDGLAGRIEDVLLAGEPTAASA